MTSHEYEIRSAIYKDGVHQTEYDRVAYSRTMDKPGVEAMLNKLGVETFGISTFERRLLDKALDAWESMDMQLLQLYQSNALAEILQSLQVYVTSTVGDTLEEFYAELLKELTPEELSDTMNEVKDDLTITSYKQIILDMMAKIVEVDGYAHVIDLVQHLSEDEILTSQQYADLLANCILQLPSATQDLFLITRLKTLGEGSANDLEAFTSALRTYWTADITRAFGYIYYGWIMNDEWAPDGKTHFAIYDYLQANWFLSVPYRNARIEELKDQ